MPDDFRAQVGASVTALKIMEAELSPNGGADPLDGLGPACMQLSSLAWQAAFPLESALNSSDCDVAERCMGGADCVIDTPTPWP
uniref:Uncharacterized protein n=1 Tax=Amphimedon queenslandica TaxID=400682 RepID=A0A1X7T8Z2_AMPQE